MAINRHQQIRTIKHLGQAKCQGMRLVLLKTNLIKLHHLSKTDGLFIVFWQSLSWYLNNPSGAVISWATLSVVRSPNSKNTDLVLWVIQEQRLLTLVTHQSHLGSLKILIPESQHSVSLGCSLGTEFFFFKLSGDYSMQLRLRTTGLELPQNPAICVTVMMHIDCRWRGMDWLGVVFCLLLPN